MIGYLTVGTNDLPRAVSFYDQLFAPLGGERFFTNSRGVGWKFGYTSTGFAVMKPFDGNRATVGNGSMVALSMEDQSQVEQVHRTALSLGATDDGAPGPRSDGFYAAYIRDLDGNKLALFYMS